MTKKNKNTARKERDKARLDELMQNPVVKVNYLQNRYVTDGNIWSVDETFFGAEISLFIVINVKTRAILGYYLGQMPINEDYVIELYSKILQHYHPHQIPLFIHSDSAPQYTSEKVLRFFKDKHIYASLSTGKQHQNQVSESVNDTIKGYTVKELLSMDDPGLRSLSHMQPNKFFGKTDVEKSRKKEYRQWLFKTTFFQAHFYDAIGKAIIHYNNQDFAKGMSRLEAEFFNSRLKGRTREELHIVGSDDVMANQIKEANIQEFKNVETQLNYIIIDKTEVSEKLARIENLVLDGQNATQEIFKMGLARLLMQNSELIDNNEKLSEQIMELQDQFNLVVDELTLAKKKREEKEDAKVKRANRKKKPARQPVSSQMYQMFIKHINGTTYTAARLRIAFCLLVVTGVRIGELRPLKVSQISTLMKDHHIAISRRKKGPASHKAFLTPEGKRVVNERKKDFELILWMKDGDSYIFSSQQKHDRMLARETLNRQVNEVMAEVAQQLPTNPYLASHSFRIGYITQLWKDTNDIEFVRQAIGHARIESTSAYVEDLPEAERQARMLNIKDAKDLIIRS